MHDVLRLYVKETGAGAGIGFPKGDKMFSETGKTKETKETEVCEEPRSGRIGILFFAKK